MTTNIIQTAKITDLRKVRTAEDLWAYQPRWRPIVPYNPNALTSVCKRATQLLGEDGTDAWVCLVSVLWAAQIYRDRGWRFDDRILDIRSCVKAARKQPKGASARREFTKENRKLATLIRYVTIKLHRDKVELEDARRHWSEREERQPTCHLNELLQCMRGEEAA